MIHLLLLDDHALFRTTLSRLLGAEQDFCVVALCSTVNEAIEALSRNQIDLILLDFDLGTRMNGLHFVHTARDAGYTGRILIVTAGMHYSDYVRALGIGVSGIVLKHSSPELLIEAIHRVMTGETWIDQRCLQELVRAVGNENRHSARHQLTDREHDVLEGVFAGLSNKEIGGGLGISEASVKSVLQQLFIKAGVRTRSQLVRVALEEGLR